MRIQAEPPLAVDSVDVTLWLTEGEEDARPSVEATATLPHAPNDSSYWLG